MVERSDEHCDFAVGEPPVGVDCDGAELLLIESDELEFVSAFDEDEELMMPGTFVWLVDIRAKHQGGACHILTARKGDSAMLKSGVGFERFEEAKVACHKENRKFWTEDEVTNTVLDVNMCGGISGNA